MNLVFNINNTSLGLTALHLLNALKEEGHEVALFPISDLDRVQAEEKYHNIIKQCLLAQHTYNPDAPSIRYWHPFDMAGHVGRGIHVGYTIFELNKFNNIELHHLRAQDCLITASQWGKRIFEENGLTQEIGVVPYGVDRSIFHEGVKPIIEFDDEPTVFINVGKKEIRKGHGELIEAFSRAFTPNDNVVLILSWYNRFLTEEENREWNNLAFGSPMGQRIFINGYNPSANMDGFAGSQNEIAGLMASADCGVSMSRSEGFGLFGLEALSCGKHLISSNCTGHTEYAHKENSLLVEMGPLEDAFDGKFFDGRGQWNSVGDEQIDQTVEYMRSIHKKKQDGELMKNDPGIETAKYFSWGNSASMLVNFLGCV